MILNGAGNGMMLGGIPYLVSQLYAKVADKKISKSFGKASEFAVIVGAAIGAVYGAKEAKELRNYRTALRDELADLRTHVDANNARLDGWAQKEQDRISAPVEPSR